MTDSACTQQLQFLMDKRLHRCPASIPDGQKAIQVHSFNSSLTVLLYMYIFSVPIEYEWKLDCVSTPHSERAWRL